jgi:hypothetical protein
MDLSKYAVKTAAGKVERNVEIKEPDSAASFKQRKLLAVIFQQQGLKFDFKSEMTKGQASEIINEHIGNLQPRQPKQSTLETLLASLR